MNKILIANRGEIAVRIIKTARRLGYATVAIFSEPDSGALHTKLADQAVAIGGRTPAESYLDASKVLEACTATGADAIHPGYGFLSENAEFADLCAQRGLTFIGPGAHAIRAMGNKSQSKELMNKSGVPCIPGYQGPEQEIDQLFERGLEIGFPIMVKAAAGGGGRGLRLAENPGQLKQLLQAARTEAEKAFGDGELLLERALTQARHVEVQVFGDTHGNVIHLGERDCSIQRRHQKVFEETPSPAVSDSLRQEMGQAAVRAAKAIHYSGAGTVEFLLDTDGRYYFLEMNTRLQVEHPVTELATGLDLVEWQLKVAEGYALPLEQEQISISNCAIEARLYAEDPFDDFRPQVGPILRWQPPSAELARTDHGLNDQDEVSPYYDSMIAKVIACGPDRETARRRLRKALNETVLLGIRTNREFLIQCLDHEEFKAARTDTGFISRTWNSSAGQPLDERLAAYAAAVILYSQLPPDGELLNWSSSGQQLSLMKLSIDGETPIALSIEPIAKNAWNIRFASSMKTVSLTNWNPAEQAATGNCQVRLGDEIHNVSFALADNTVHISTGDFSFSATDVSYTRQQSKESLDDGDIVSPSNGLLAAICVQVGQFVEKGTPVCTVEAMKLLQSICSPVSGQVTEVCCQEGQQVKARQLLVRMASIEAQIPAVEEKTLVEV
jgi:geranyl-CoA carboxylase alpha subunit